MSDQTDTEPGKDGSEGQAATVPILPVPVGSGFEVFGEEVWFLIDRHRFGDDVYPDAVMPFGELPEKE